MASKVQERTFVQAFLDRLGGQHGIDEERESPDFLVSGAGEKFGLEVAQVFRDQHLICDRGSKAKAVESDRSKFLSRLADDYYRADGRPLFAKALIPNLVAAAECDGLLDRILRARPGVSWARERVEVDGAILELCALPPAAGHYKRWVAIDNSIGWRGKIGIEHILPAIERKAACLTRYRSVVNRVELLLVVDTTRASGMVRWDPDSPFPSSHGFDAIHLYFHPVGGVRVG